MKLTFITLSFLILPLMGYSFPKKKVYVEDTSVENLNGQELKEIQDFKKRFDFVFKNVLKSFQQEYDFALLKTLEETPDIVIKSWFEGEVFIRRKLKGTFQNPDFPYIISFEVFNDSVSYGKSEFLPITEDLLNMSNLELIEYLQFQLRKEGDSGEIQYFIILNQINAITSRELSPSNTFEKENYNFLLESIEFNNADSDFKKDISTLVNNELVEFQKYIVEYKSRYHQFNYFSFSDSYTSVDTLSEKFIRIRVKGDFNENDNTYQLDVSMHSLGKQIRFIPLFEKPILFKEKDKYSFYHLVESLQSRVSALMIAILLDE